METITISSSALIYTYDSDKFDMDCHDHHYI